MTLPLEIVVIALFIVFIAGYAVGRRQGRQEGFVEGVNYAPLEMRRVSWEKGRCIICGKAGKQSALGPLVEGRIRPPSCEPDPPQGNVGLGSEQEFRENC